MAMDMEQFKVTFIEESTEGLDVMETMLLDLRPDSDDDEAINTIFRAAHSIKGGAATFGFAVIAEFTHVIETLLDEIRTKTRSVSQEAIELFLESVDSLRMLLSNEEPDESQLEKVKKLKSALDVMLGTNPTVESESSGLAEDESAESIIGWSIQFKPFGEMLKTGNDVVRMFRELEELGGIVVKVNTSNLPPYEDLDPELCYLSWDLTLDGNIDKSLVEEIFLWVDGECELTISGINDGNSSAYSENSVELDGKDLASSTNGKVSNIADIKPAQSKDKQATKSRPAESSSIRVGIEKVDDLINMVGELVITQSMLSQLGKADIDDFDIVRIEKMREGLSQLERNTRELQESVMRIRMLPISFTFNRFPRMVHDMCRKLDKKIELQVSGEATELDKTVMEKIGDPLVHIIRNSCDHGIETPEKRLASGKPETGTVHLDAYHQGGDIVIEIKDDGAGLNKERIFKKAVDNGIITENAELTEEQIFDLLFMPGFSTAEKVTDVSGRGVGMDVVKRNVQALGGRVEVTSELGVGSTFTIRLPLTMAILDGQLIRVGSDVYIVPLVSIIESMQLKEGMVRKLAGTAELYRLRNEYLPIVRLYETFDLEADSHVLTDGLVVVVESGNGQKAGLYVDDLLDQQQVVIKSLETNFRVVEGISGATILGDGRVALILDVGSLIRLAHKKIRPGDLRQLANHAEVA